MERRFELGQLLVTRDVHRRMADDPKFETFVLDSLRRYVKCDWGELCKEDKSLNDCAVEHGDGRILASYVSNGEKKEKIWIITEADRKYTTVLFPNEY